MMYLENKSKRNHKLLEYYCNDGLYGSFSSFPRDSELFFTGSCDTSTTLSFELEIVSSSQTIEDYVYVEDRDRLLKPCVQTCFAYTSVVKINGKWATVRRMRVSTHVLHLSDNTEAITSSLNPEALAIVSTYTCLYIYIHMYIHRFFAQYSYWFSLFRTFCVHLESISRIICIIIEQRPNINQ